MDHWLRAYGQLRSSFLQIFQWSRANILSLEKSIYPPEGPCGPWVGAICGCTRDTLCGHLVTCVKITKSWVGLRVRNSGFPCVHSPSHCDFTSICQLWEENIKFIVLLLLFLGISLLIVWPGGRSSQSPCVSTGLLWLQGFHMSWGPRDHMDQIWEDSQGPSSL